MWLTNGALGLVDKREEMKGLIGRRGWTSLKVMNEKKRKRDIKIRWRKITPNYRAVVKTGAGG